MLTLEHTVARQTYLVLLPDMSDCHFALFLLVNRSLKGVTASMEQVKEVEAVVSELKKQLEDKDLNPEQKLVLLNSSLNSEITHPYLFRSESAHTPTNS